MTNEVKKRVLKTLLIIHITFGAIITPLASLIVLGMEQEIASLAVLVFCIVAYIYFPYRALKAVSANRFYPSIVHSVFTIFCSILMPLGIVQLFLAIKLKNNFTVESAAGVVDVIDVVDAEIPVKLQQTIELSQSSHDSVSERKKTKTVYIILAAIVAAFLISIHQQNEGLVATNNIMEVDNTRLLSIAAEMNTPEWNDVLVEVTEWLAVSAIVLGTSGFLAKIAVPVKVWRSGTKAAKKAKAVNNTHALLKGIAEKFSKALARPFNKKAIKLVPKTSGVYLFFDKRGRVKYVGKAMDLRLRLSQHLSGPASSGNLYLSKNAKSLSFIAIPIKSIGDEKGAIKCMEAITIKLFLSEDLINKRVEKINRNDCRQLIRSKP